MEEGSTRGGTITNDPTATTPPKATQKTETLKEWFSSVSASISPTLFMPGAGDLVPSPYVEPHELDVALGSWFTARSWTPSACASYEYSDLLKAYVETQGVCSYDAMMAKHEAALKRNDTKTTHQAEQAKEKKKREAEKALQKRLKEQEKAVKKAQQEQEKAIKKALAEAKRQAKKAKGQGTGTFTADSIAAIPISAAPAASQDNNEVSMAAPPTAEVDDEDENDDDDDENEEKVPRVPLKARKHRLDLDTKQKELLNDWLNAYIWTYNHLVKVSEGKDVPKTLKSFRSICVKNDAIKALDVSERTRQLLLRTPWNIRSGAAKELYQSYKAAFKRLEKGGENDKRLFFKMHPKEHGKANKTLPVYKMDWGHSISKYGLEHVFRADKLKFKDGFTAPEKLPYDCVLLKDRCGRFFLCVPQPREVRSVPARDHLRVIAMDPGVRTFMTGYDPRRGQIWEWGRGDFKHLVCLCMRADALLAKKANAKGKGLRRARRLMRRAFLRIYERIRNKVAELHWKLAKWLCENYDLIVLPKFDTKSMVKKRKGDKWIRKIGSKTARAMCTWSHYTFRQRLLFKATEYPGVKVQICMEEFTSKTCGSCGKLHKELEAQKTFCCPSCGLTIDRDANGARNILLKELTGFSSTLAPKKKAASKARVVSGPAAQGKKAVSSSPTAVVVVAAAAAATTATKSTRTPRGKKSGERSHELPALAAQPATVAGVKRNRSSMSSEVSTSETPQGNGTKKAMKSAEATNASPPASPPVLPVWTTGPTAPTGALETPIIGTYATH